MTYNWNDYFAYDYLEDHTGYFSQERLSQEINFLTKNIIPTPDATVLDLACGQGRHSIALHQAGYSVLGVDRDEQLLNMAQTESANKKLNIMFVRQDMRELNLDQKYDIILLMFCTFGIESDQTNKLILQRLTKHLKPGGRVFFDVHNLYRFARRMKQSETAIAKLDLNTLLLWDNVDGELVLPLRLYTIPELEERLETVGLRILKTWGNYDASAYDFDSERLLLLTELT